MGDKVTQHAERRPGRAQRYTGQVGALAGVTVRAGGFAFTAAPWLLSAYVAVSLVQGALPVAVAWLTKSVLDHITGGASFDSTIVPALGLVVTGLLTGALPHFATYARTSLSRRVGLRAQAGLFASMGRLPGLARFEDAHFLDRLQIAKRQGGGEALYLVDHTLGMATAALTISGFVGSLFATAPTLGVVVMLFGLAVVVAEVSLSRERVDLVRATTPDERRELFYEQLLTDVEAIKEMRLFGIGSMFQQRMLSARTRINRARDSLDRRMLRVQAVLALAAASIAGCGLVWAIAVACRGELSVGDVTMLVAAVSSIQGALAVLAASVASTHELAALFQQFMGLLSVEPDLPLTPHPEKTHPLQHGIELRDVWFRYGDDQEWVLRGVNLSISVGGTTALVGLNGAGKSTLIKLLCRFYDPTRGAILWDGTDIRELDITEYRNRIAAAFQEYMRYDMTAHENIAIGDLTAWQDSPRVRRAAHRAGVHEALTRLPRGYETQLSRIHVLESATSGDEPGVLLSGGQWQRVAIARALLREDRDFLILDEPSASLDPEAEQEVLATLAGFRKGRTSLLVSHRLGAVRSAEKIVVLARGRVVECGTHEELMDRAGIYSRLFAAQASGYVDHEPVPARE